MTAKKPNKKIPVRQKSGGISYEHDTAFIRFLAEQKNAAHNYAGAINIDKKLGSLNWRGDAAIPPGSPPHDILEAFRFHTDLPLDLAWHSFLFFLSTHCLAKGVTIECDGQTITPELWTVVLAPSGSGKSYSLSRIKKGAPVAATIEGIASGAKLIEQMQENELQGLPNAMLVDEFGQMLKSLETDGSPLSDAKQYFLLAYDGDKIERNTLKKSTVVEDSHMSMLGLNVDETFIKILSPESLLDGFAQRFAYALAERDEERHFSDYPRYNNAQIEAVVVQAWAKLLAVPLHETYVYSVEALDAYDNEFRNMGRIIDEGKQINVSFFRRLMQRTHKLALMMHLILGDSSNIISKTDVLWAMRQTRLHIADAARLIAMKSPNTNKIMESVEGLAERLAVKGQKLTARAINQHVHAARHNPELCQDALEAYNNMQAAKRKEASPATSEALLSDLPLAAPSYAKQPSTVKAVAKKTPERGTADMDALIVDHTDDKGRNVYDAKQ